MPFPSPRERRVVQNSRAEPLPARMQSLVAVLEVRPEAGGSLAVAIRKDNPKLLAALNTFMGNYGLGTGFGDRIDRQYLVSTKYATGATSEQARKKFERPVIHVVSHVRDSAPA